MLTMKCGKRKGNSERIGINLTLGGEGRSGEEEVETGSRATTKERS
jgi:hypothetical protein